MEKNQNWNRKKIEQNQNRSILKNYWINIVYFHYVQGHHCSRCMYTAHCTGCSVPESGMVDLQSSDTLAVRYTENVPTIVPPVDHISESKQRPHHPLSLYDCLQAFSQRCVCPKESCQEREKLEISPPSFVNEKLRIKKKCIYFFFFQRNVGRTQSMVLSEMREKSVRNEDTNCASLSHVPHSLPQEVNFKIPHFSSISIFPKIFSFSFIHSFFSTRYRFVFYECVSMKLDDKVTFPLAGLSVGRHLYDLYACVCHFGGKDFGLRFIKFDFIQISRNLRIFLFFCLDFKWNFHIKLEIQNFHIFLLFCLGFN